MTNVKFSRVRTSLNNEGCLFSTWLCLFSFLTFIRFYVITLRDRELHVHMYQPHTWHALPC